MTKRLDSDLEIYLNEIRALPLLTAQQERDLAIRIRDGDIEARDLLIRSNLRLVVNIAYQHRGRGSPLADLIEEGNLGLIRAVEGFDTNYNTRFSTYASFWIKQSIKRSIINTSKVIKIPAHLVELLRKWQKAKAELTIQDQDEPTDNQIAEQAGVKKKQIELIKKAQKLHRISTSEQDEQEPFLDSLTTKETESYLPIEIETLLKYMNRLPPQENDIIRMRFGINCDQLTLQRIGEVTGVTKEWIRQIEARAITRLQCWMGENPTSQNSDNKWHLFGVTREKAVDWQFPVDLVSGGGH